MSENNALNFIVKLDKAMTSIVKAICISLLVAIIITVSVSVLTRALLPSSITFTDGIATYCMVWLSFLGMGLAARENQHVSVDMLINKFDKKGKKRFIIIGNILVSLFLVVVVYYGLIFAFNGAGSKDYLVFGLSMLYPYLSISIGALFCLVQLNIVTLLHVLEDR